MMRVLNYDQGSDEWKRARAGRFTASRIADVIAKTKSGYAASRKNYLAELLIERMTGEPTEFFVSYEMRRGTELEPEARSIYEFRSDVSVDQVGLVLHPMLDYAGASPDGLVGDHGGVEIKCPNTATHIETMRTGKIPHRYYVQMQWCMECTQRDWWDFISYDPRLKDERLVIYTSRVERDDVLLDDIRREVVRANEDLERMITELEEVAGRVAS